jgi:hypothetical protein
MCGIIPLSLSANSSASIDDGRTSPPQKISGEFRGKFGRYIDALCSSVEPEKN